MDNTGIFLDNGITKHNEEVVPMEQYKSNVAAVMEYLKSEGFSASTISLHKLCYQGLEDFLMTTGQAYSFNAAGQWIEDNQSSWNYRRYTG